MDKDSFFLSKGKIFASFTSGVLAGRGFCGGGGGSPASGVEVPDAAMWERIFRRPFPRGSGAGFTSDGGAGDGSAGCGGWSTATPCLRTCCAWYGVTSGGIFRRFAGGRRKSVHAGPPVHSSDFRAFKKSGVREAGRRRAQKKGELLASHRYNHIPLLDSSPGGFCRSWSCKTHPGCKSRNIFLSLQKNWRNA